MLNNKRVRRAWRACTALAVLLVAGCVSAAPEESGEGVPASDSSAGAEGRAATSLIDGGLGSVGGADSVDSVAGGVSAGGGDASSVSSTSSSLLEGASISGVEGEGVVGEEEFEWNEEFRDVLMYNRPDDFSSYSDETILALAFHHRALLKDDAWGVDLNDLSTSLGALCWIILNAQMVMPIVLDGLVWPSIRYGVGGNLRVWHLEREVEERGLELFWDGGPVDDMRTLRHVLQTAREVRGVVLGSDLLPVLRPLAEELYAWIDELWEMPVVRVRPTLEKLTSGYNGSPYRGLEGITEEEITQIWPEEFEIGLTDESFTDFWKSLMVERLAGDKEVLGLLDAGCEVRRNDLYAGACPAWVADVLSRIECRTRGELDCPFGGCASEQGSGLDN